ncbi:MAG: hypothetical protein FWC06_01425 [Treponema sp.]|nr:hypothetical protein [Treponema sp.]
MKDGVQELLFQSRNDFRTWLRENAQTSGGVWLIFGKTRELVSLKANDALEEALCFGWIDGQMKSLDKTRYIKYFARRRPKSSWSEKNKKIAQTLIEKKLMTKSGKKAIENAKKDGTWDFGKSSSINDEQVEELIKKLSGISPAYENFINMSRSVKLTYTRRYFSFKSEETRQRDFLKIVERLNNNLKPM